MQYQGGKSRIAKDIAALILKYNDGRTYVEPFVGGGSVLVEVAPHWSPGAVLASDSNHALVTMWQYLQQGWVPPDEVGEAEYRQYAANPDPADPMTAFVLIGCSWGGKWRGGYARNAKGDNYAIRAKRSLLAKVPVIRRTNIWRANYQDLVVDRPYVIYCDPPYAATTGYGESRGRFDHEEFWATVRSWVSTGSTVLVSEESAPGDFEAVWERPYNRNTRDKSGRPKAVVERVFMIKGSDANV